MDKDKSDPEETETVKIGLEKDTADIIDYSIRSDLARAGYNCGYQAAIRHMVLGMALIMACAMIFENTFRRD